MLAAPQGSGRARRRPHFYELPRDQKLLDMAVLFPDGIIASDAMPCPEQPGTVTSHVSLSWITKRASAANLGVSVGLSGLSHGSGR